MKPMKHLKTFENLQDMFKRYIILKHNQIGYCFILELPTYIYNDQSTITLSKRYTLKKDNTIEKNNGQSYTLNPKLILTEKPSRIVYMTDSLIDALNVLKTISETNKYNL